ncbi:hypothetical protein E2C01_073117 [Portunus trituberculatus]|uniref:Uncharacterized protein n=1 Tax=Portunus trituberculatus TaxID=210409 RepID=A0A5B7I915_PORTR|nr:hypothetical protein [Portunus trituberculatus]
MRRLINVERELRYMKEVMSSLMDKQDRLITENTALKLRVAECEKEQEEEKVEFSEVVRKQIQENTKVTVIKVIKEKDDLMRDAVDKKKSFVIYGMKEKKNPSKFIRERKEKELAKTVIKRVQDSTQEFDQKVEEVIRLGRYSKGGRRPMKVKMRSQVAVEEIMGRKGKLADDVEHKDIRIKRDMN